MLLENNHVFSIPEIQQLIVNKNTQMTITIDKEVLNFMNEFELIFNDKIYLVGGAVRDILSKSTKEIHDYDFCTRVPYDLILQKYNGTAIGASFRIVQIKFGSHKFEIANFRKDINHDGRWSECIFDGVTIEEDLQRRDLTINALAITPNKLYKDTYNLIDVVGGYQDLKNKIIRFVGDPYECIKEDHLRILRAIRFEFAMNFTLDGITYNALIANMHLLKNISRERVRDELYKILSFRYYKGIDKQKIFLLNSLFYNIFGEDYFKIISFDQNSKYHEFTLDVHTILSTFESIHVQASFVKSKEPLKIHLIRLALLLHDIGKPCVETTSADGFSHYINHQKQSVLIAEKILNNLKVKKDDKNFILELIKYHHDFFSYTLSPLGVTNAEIRHSIYKLKYASSLDLFLVKRADFFNKKIGVDPFVSISQSDATHYKRLMNIMSDDKNIKSHKDLNITYNIFDKFEQYKINKDKYSLLLDKIIKWVIYQDKNNEKDITNYLKQIINSYY